MFCRSCSLTQAIRANVFGQLMLVSISPLHAAASTSCCCEQWRAAGVLVYEFDEDGEMQLLLARQDHSDQKGSKSGRTRHRAWNLLGAAPAREC